MKSALRFALVMLGITGVAASTEVDDFQSWLSQGTVGVDVRLRYEGVDQGLANSADALTVRNRVALRTGEWNGFSLLLEGEDVRALVEDYNSTGNGRIGFPVVADPEGGEINQAALSYQRGLGTATLGRQKISLDNQRFFGAAGFRQNEQTFDAASFVYANEVYTARMIYVDQVHRVFGNSNPNRLLRQQDLSGLIATFGYQTTLGLLRLYGHLIENVDIPLSSTQTFGVRFDGLYKPSDHWNISYVSELARQSDYADAAAASAARYALFELGIGHSRWLQSLRLGTERLGGDGRSAFQTPFATLHMFNGWADTFLTTPVSGLRDWYLEYGAKLGPGRALVQLHRFDAEQGSQRYGDEFGLQYTWPLRPDLTMTLKWANYRARAFGRDTEKLWLSFDYSRK